LKEQYSKKAKQTTIKNMVKINLHTGKIKKITVNIQWWTLIS